MKRFAAIALALALLAAGSATALAYPPDIEGSWAEEHIRFCIDERIMLGLPDGTFDPAGNVTYGQFFTIVTRIIRENGLLQPPLGELVSDEADQARYQSLAGGDLDAALATLSEAFGVSSVGGHWANQSMVDWFRYMRYHTPSVNSEFYRYRGDIDSNVTREFVFAVVDEVLFASFSDYGAAERADHFTDIASGYEDIASRLYESGVVTGYPDGTLRPQNGIRRDEMTAVLRKVIEYIGAQCSVGEVDISEFVPDFDAYAAPPDEEDLSEEQVEEFADADPEAQLEEELSTILESLADTEPE